MNDTKLEQHLQKHYQNLYGNPPAAEHMWKRIAPELAMQERKVIWWRRMFMSKHATNKPIVATQREHRSRRAVLHTGTLVASLIIGLATIGATAYAATGGAQLADLFEYLGIKSMAQQFSDYHQSKSVDGYTLTIQKAYADTNRVLIGYTGEAPTGKSFAGKFAPGEGELTTEQGIKLRNMGGIATGTESGNLFAYDASGIQGTPKELHLYLAIPYGSQPQNSGFQMEGYLTFNIIVPFHPGKVLQMNHAVTSSGKPETKQASYHDAVAGIVKGQVEVLHGKTVTLQKVVIAPTETRAYIQGFDRADYTNIAFSRLDFKLTIDGHEYSASMIYAGTNAWQVNFDDPSLASKKGQWILTIQQTISEIDSKEKAYETPGATWNIPFIVK
ncbi:MAG TPA: DUF4179 domain-containing protein [Ktedonobacteraceae bacterium]|jgi:hypothetical protein|nr:DUF4179 domain-containing protein [Ktedonobacteraceae bacterium]